jgi:hypothetical protein
MYRPACTAGDALYAMELSLSLEKLNFDKLLQLWQASDNTCCQAVRACPLACFVPYPPASPAAPAASSCPTLLLTLRCAHLASPCCPNRPVLQVVDKHGDPQMTQYIEDMLQDQVGAGGVFVSGIDGLCRCRRRSCCRRWHHVEGGS